MGRSLKQRKLKKVSRFRVRPTTPDPKTVKKTTMKQWEWWLIGGAIVLAALWVIILGLKGGLSPDIQPTATPVATQTGR